MLKSGAQANVRDKEGKTPLALALAEGNAEAAQILLEHGRTE